jgi:hypothetical protein
MELFKEITYEWWFWRFVKIEFLSLKSVGVSEKYFASPMCVLPKCFKLPIKDSAFLDEDCGGLQQSHKTKISKSILQNNAVILLLTIREG